MPSAVRARAIASPSAGASRDSSRGACSTMQARTPRRLKAWAISTPTGPRRRAPAGPRELLAPGRLAVGPDALESLRPSIGGNAGSLPVAMTMLVAR
jgi:hypothetical protein